MSEDLWEKLLKKNREDLYRMEIADEEVPND